MFRIAVACDPELTGTLVRQFGTRRNIEWVLAEHLSPERFGDGSLAAVFLDWRPGNDVIVRKAIRNRIPLIAVANDADLTEAELNRLTMAVKRHRTHCVMVPSCRFLPPVAKLREWLCVNTSAGPPAIQVSIPEATLETIPLYLWIDMIFWLAGTDLQPAVQHVPGGCKIDSLPENDRQVPGDFSTSSICIRMAGDGWEASTSFEIESLFCSSRGNPAVCCLQRGDRQIRTLVPPGIPALRLELSLAVNQLQRGLQETLLMKPGDLARAQAVLMK